MGGSLQHVDRSAGPAQDGTTEGRRGRRGHRIMWGALATFILLAGLAIFAAVRQGVDAIDLKNGTITFSSVRPSDIAARQTAVASQVAAAEQRAQRAQQEPAVSVPDVSGDWRADSGLIYRITQYGDQFVLQELSPYGVTAYGQGQVTGQRADFTFWAFNSTTGTGEFQVMDDRTMHAWFQNSQGLSSQAVLSR